MFAPVHAYRWSIVGQSGPAKQWESPKFGTRGPPVRQVKMIPYPTITISAIFSATRFHLRPSGDVGVRSAPKTPESESDARKRLQRVFWWARQAVWAVATILAFAFLWLQWKDYLEGGLVDKVSKVVVIKLALGIYYFSWIFACRFDLKIQESVYIIDPNKGALPKSFFLLTPLFLVGAALLLWAADHETYLPYFITTFFAIDTVLWIYTRKWAIPIAEATRRHHSSNPERYFYIAQIDVVEELMCGKYQIYRHIALFALIAAFDMIALFDTPKEFISLLIHAVNSDISERSMSELLPAAFLLGYVLACELSMWFMRARALLSLKIIDRLHMKYRFVLR
jgi:hypothetical protein